MSVTCRLRSPLPPNQAIRANQADAPRNIPGVRNAKTPGRLTEGSGMAQSALLVRGVRQRKTPQSADQGVQASGCCRLLGDYLGIERWFVNAQLSPTATSRAAVAASTWRQAPGLHSVITVHAARRPCSAVSPGAVWYAREARSYA